MSDHVVKAVMILSVAVLAGACAQAPTERADAARARIESLGPEARVHAPEEFREAQESVARLEAELEAQAQGFAFGRSYDRTNELIDEVDAAAQNVSRAIDAGKARAAAEAEAARQAEAEAQAALEKPEPEEPADVAEFAPPPPGHARLPQAVMADGKPLAAGTYRLRLADEAPAGDAAIRPGRWVEFVSNGTVAGRSLAVVVPDAEIREIAESSVPRNEAWVAELRGGEYVRVWLNREGMHYLMHLPRS
jgi:hypothetical protein